MRLPWTSRDDRGALSSQGRVACPVVGDTDVERCFICPRLERMADLGTTIRVECRGPRLDEDPTLRFPFIGA